MANSFVVEETGVPMYTLEKWWQRWDLGMIENEIVFVFRYIVTQRGFIIVVLACVLIKLC
jgi:hypothetical protein